MDNFSATVQHRSDSKLERFVMLYEGSCHCGNVAFTVEGEIKEAMACNCSMCQRKGALMWFTPYSKVSLKTPEDAMATYQFNKHHINHKFCKTCGIHALADGLDGKGNKMAMINIRALENLEIESLPIKHYDGRSA